MILEAIKYQVDRRNKLPLEKSNFFLANMSIFFYRTPNCIGRNQIQEVLERLVIAHKVITIHSVEKIRDKIPSVTTLPALVDEEKVVQGSDLIVARLEEIEKFNELWDKFQSDACSCDEDALD